jgi:hypothetical protein
MSVYDACGSCKGSGSFKCNDCQCRQCNATGSVQATCTRCNGASKVTCTKCQGAGQLLKKKGFFSDTYEKCWMCSGSRQEHCSCQSGKVSVQCPACKGTKRNAQCPRCGAKGSIRCTACEGSGKVPSEWYKSLARMPVEKLKFEYEKRQRNISTLRMKASSLTRDYEQSERECDEYQEERRAHGEMHPDLIGENYRNRLIGEMGSVESQISEAEVEMSAIEKVMDANWK